MKKLSIGLGITILIAISLYLYDGEILLNAIYDRKALLVFIVYVMWVLLEGKRDAYNFHFKSMSVNTDDGEHTTFWIERILIMGLITTLCDLPSTLSLWFMFAFIHNGFYYYTRNKLNSNFYKKKWFDQSTSSVTWFTKISTPVIRTLGAVLGLISYILLNMK